MAASQTPVLYSDQKTVAVAGTAERLVAASLRVRSVVIGAKSGNTGKVFIGGSDVASTTNGGLAANSTLTITAEAASFFDLTDIWVNAAVSGEGVDFYGMKA